MRRRRYLTLMKLHLTNAEVGMWNAEGWNRCALSLLLNKEAVIFEDLAALRSLMKPHQVKSEPQNIEYRRVGSLRPVIFYKIDRIPYFGIRYSLLTKS